MMKYIYEFYLSSGISPAMITAITQALIGTGVILGAIMIHKVFMISREMKELPSMGLSEEQWNTSVDEVIRHYKMKHAVPLIAATYVALLMLIILLSYDNSGNIDPYYGKEISDCKGEIR